MYNRDVIDVPYIIRGIQYTTSDCTQNRRNDLTRKLLQLRIARYLSGKGHVKSPMISQELFDAERDSPTLRARLFIKTLTDSVLIDPGRFQITVSLSLLHLCTIYPYLIFLRSDNDLPSTYRHGIPPERQVHGARTKGEIRGQTIP